MAKLNQVQCLIAFICAAALLFFETYATTDVLEVQSLQDLFISLNFPQLTGWKTYGGDPCLDGWKGITCNGNTIQSINVTGLGITGSLGHQLSNLHSLREFDASFNGIHGEMPFNLPPNASYINLSYNQFTGTIPPSLASMTCLSVLNLSHNSFYGPLADYFTGLLNLKQMDLSYNNFIGDLPFSFTALTNLTVLSLQNNQFTGSVNYLANLPLIELNIQNNHFTGIVPKNVQDIPKLCTDSNLSETGAALWPHNPEHNTSMASNRRNPSVNQSSAAKNDPSLKADAHKHKLWGPAIVASVVGAMLVASCAFAIIAVLIHLSRKNALEEFPISLSSFPGTRIDELSETWSTGPSLNIQMPTPSSDSGSQGRMERFLRASRNLLRCRAPETTKRYSIAELLAATNNFTNDNLIRRCFLGSVYKGTFGNGQVVAVTMMYLLPLSNLEKDRFLEVVWSMSSVRHQNIVSLLGYGMECQLYLLVYQYAGHSALDDSLHFAQETGSSLSWHTRVKIAFGVAQALAYLHLECSPPITHGDIKASTVLLDEEFNPHISDCGLAVLRPFTFSGILRTSEMRWRGAAYTTTATDIYAYGVLLLELLTGKRPFDSSRGRNKQCLVKWAATLLREFGSLEEMVDPTIRGSYSFSGLLRFTEAIRLCTQMEADLRPPISLVAGVLGFQI